jgi:hypothetical protein
MRVLFVDPCQTDEQQTSRSAYIPDSVTAKYMPFLFRVHVLTQPMFSQHLARHDTCVTVCQQPLTSICPRVVLFTLIASETERARNALC